MCVSFFLNNLTGNINTCKKVRCLRVCPLKFSFLHPRYCIADSCRSLFPDKEARKWGDVRQYLWIALRKSCNKKYTVKHRCMFFLFIFFYFMFYLFIYFYLFIFFIYFIYLFILFIYLFIYLFILFYFFFGFGFYGPFKNISLILSRSFIKGGRNPGELGEKPSDHLGFHTCDPSETMHVYLD